MVPGDFTIFLAPDAGAARRARKTMAGPLDGWGLRNLQDDAALIVGELVANAAKLGQPFALTLTAKGQTLRISVSDHSSDKPVIATQPGDDRAEDGRGLLVVDALADAWGFEPRPGGGKIVWAELTSSTDAPVTTVGTMDRDMSPDAHARRASSFGGRAAAYAAERPGYPDAAIRWVLEPVSDAAPPRVLDLAAGTGKLTAGLVRHGADVVAVEPDAGMLAELRRLMPRVRALAGSAERIPLADASVEAVVVGQAMHWFDLDRALPEVSRVLAPGGVLAGLWNLDDDRVPWVRGFKEVARSEVAFTRWRGHASIEPTPWFPDLEYATFEHSMRRTAESLAATLGTHSHVLVLPEHERAALMGEVLDYLHATPETAAGEFDLPLVTIALRAIRA